MSQQSAPLPARLTAWLVHLYTATGLLAALAATVAVFDGAYRASFLWMVAATVIDATDGVLARRARVSTVLPGFDGAHLDDIVDYLTFVFVPALLMFHAGMLPAGSPGAAVVSLVLLSSGYGFASTDAKTSDHFFTGFPSYWNIVALYLFAARLAPWANAGVLVVLSALVFVRIGYVYPSRTPVLARTTIALGAIWGIMVVALVLSLPDAPRWLLVTSLFYPVYYTGLSFALQRSRRRPIGRVA